MYLKPTDSELEILNVLWANGPSTVRNVHNYLSETKGVGYTTTLKLMQIMHDKGLLYRTQQGRLHIYVALLGKEETQQNLLARLIQTTFQGSASDAVISLLENQSLNATEIIKIREVLDGLESKVD